MAVRGTRTAMTMNQARARGHRAWAGPRPRMDAMATVQRKRAQRLSPTYAQSDGRSGRTSSAQVPARSTALERDETAERPARQRRGPATATARARATAMPHGRPRTGPQRHRVAAASGIGASLLSDSYLGGRHRQPAYPGRESTASMTVPEAEGESRATASSPPATRFTRSRCPSDGRPSRRSRRGPTPGHKEREQVRGRWALASSCDRRLSGGAVRLAGPTRRSGT